MSGRGDPPKDPPWATDPDSPADPVSADDQDSTDGQNSTDQPNILDADRGEVAPLYGKDEPQPEAALTFFRVLGHSRDRFYFLPARGRQIICLKAFDLGRKPALFMLAPRQWWEREFPSKVGFDVDAACNWLIASSFLSGVYQPDRVRGRGIWSDDGRTVVHGGNYLYLDGQRTELLQIKSRYVYEELPALDLDPSNPLKQPEAAKLITFANALNWSCPTYGDLLAGWIVTSMASGAIPWRPHILLTGPKGCGKSWVMDIIASVLGSFALSVKGETSPAGLRQSLKDSALPVLFDEAEGDGSRAAANMAGIIALMRQASADGAGQVVKGGADGEASGYTVRSSFLLGAIRDPLRQAADESRVTVLSLQQNEVARSKNFKNQIKPLGELISNPAWAERFRAYVVSRVPLLLESIGVFVEAGAEYFGDRRMADQIGAMAAGCHVLTSPQGKPPTFDSAMAWYRGRLWLDQGEIIDESRDEHRLLHSLLQEIIVVDVDRGRLSLSVAELIEIARGTNITSTVFAGNASDTLARHGLRVNEDSIQVATHHRMISKFLEHTEWPQGWGRILLRIDTATKSGSTRFAGLVSKSVTIPFSEFLDAQPP